MPRPPRMMSHPASTAAVHAEALASIEARIAPLVRALGFEVVTTEWQGRSRGTLRVYIDHPDGVTVADCARVSRVVEQELEAAELEDAAVGSLLAGAYDLEVSSPGIERPLARRAHFETFVGHRARIRLAEPLPDHPGRRNYVGRIEGVEDGEDGPVVRMALASPPETRVRIPLSAVRKAHLVYED